LAAFIGPAREVLTRSRFTIARLRNCYKPAKIVFCAHLNVLLHAAYVMRKVIFARNAAVLVTKRYGENADFVNSMAFHACVCTKSPGSLTLKLLRELTCRPFRSITRKYLFHTLHTF